MGIAPTIEKYLADRGVAYEVRAHRPTASASRTAEASHVPGDAVAKAVVLRDAAGGHLLAVLPASHEIDFDALNRLLGREVALASEEEASRLFPDCATGAVPAIGAAYGLDVVADERLPGEHPEVWFEGGDHATLVRVTGEGFRTLVADAVRGRFGAVHWTQAVHPRG